MKNVVCFNRECGVEYAIPDHVYAQAMRFGKDRTVHCPNGHGWYYSHDALADTQRKLECAQRERDDYERAYLRQERLARYWKGIAHRRRK